MIILLNDARSGTNGVIRMHIIFKCHCLSVNRHVKKVAVCHIYRALFTRVISGSAVKAGSLLSFLYLAGHDFSLCGEDLNHRHKSHSNQWQNGESQYDNLMSKLNAIRLLAIRRCNKLVGVKIGNDFFKHQFVFITWQKYAYRYRFHCCYHYHHHHCVRVLCEFLWWLNTWKLYGVLENMFHLIVLYTFQSHFNYYGIFFFVSYRPKHLSEGISMLVTRTEMNH